MFWLALVVAHLACAGHGRRLNDGIEKLGSRSASLSRHEVRLGGREDAAGASQGAVNFRQLAAILITTLSPQAAFNPSGPRGLLPACSLSLATARRQERALSALCQMQELDETPQEVLAGTTNVDSATEAKKVALRTLIQMARVYNSLHSARTRLVSPLRDEDTGLQALSSFMKADCDAVASNLQTLAAMTTVEAPFVNLQGLTALKSEAARLHTQVSEQEAKIQILEQEALVTSSTDRAKEMFKMLDTDEDGTLNLEELSARLTPLLPVGPEKLQAKLAGVMKEQDVNSDGELDFDEFNAMLTSLSRDSLGPSQMELASTLAQLIKVTLELVSRTISRELSEQSLARLARIGQLEICVEKWCTLSDQAEALFKKEVLVEMEGQADDRTRALNISEEHQASSAIALNADRQYRPKEHIGKLQSLLEQVGMLATKLSMKNVTKSRTFLWRDRGRQAWIGLLKKLRFCGRGFRLVAGDFVQTVSLLSRVLVGRRLTSREGSIIKRSLLDGIALIPYTIIGIIPMSPPGHMFAYSLWNRFFPKLVPSAFTRQRQDIDEIYSRIATSAEASNKSALEQFSYALRKARTGLKRSIKRIAKRRN